MIDYVERIYFKIRRWFSRSEISLKLLKLPKYRRRPHQPGLILIQVDGLAYEQFVRAVDRGRMPHLKRLMDKQNYRLHEFYSGCPSTTPAVQGELFYGVRQAVPAFCFREPETQELVRMFDVEAARRVEARLMKLGGPLLKGGSAYCDIYSAGALPRFCAPELGLGPTLKSLNRIVLLGLLLSHGSIFFRYAALALVELGISIVDFFRGVRYGESFLKELKFIITRVMVTITLREVMVIGAQLDLARGMPIIHMNFLGFDEQAHRRGPDSAFAHWTLKGIDGAIRAVTRASRLSSIRDYEVWIYSDHGQIRTIPYGRENGEEIQAAVARVFEKFGVGAEVVKASPLPSAGRAQWLDFRWLRPWASPRDNAAGRAGPGAIKVASMGPIGHVYPPGELTPEQIDRIARDLAIDANVPLVMIPAAAPGEALAYTRHRVYHLPREADQLFPPSRFRDEIAADFAKLAHHPYAGTFVLSGFRPDGPRVTFAVENGSHAGPDFNECRGFALLPAHAPIEWNGRDYMRPETLRDTALHALGRMPERYSRKANARPPARKTIRILSYNTHSCIGMDGRLSVNRIAAVIMQTEPDIVALQELDVGRRRTELLDQAHEIARHMEMDFHFHPALAVEEELYGDAILSSLPVRLARRGALPGHPRREGLEPRGAIWVTVDVNGRELQLVNTHLGLRGPERLAQARALVGPEWLGSEQCKGPAVLVGDFNALPGTLCYKTLASRMLDAQTLVNGHRPKPTFFGRYPWGRIDHVFVTPGVKVHRIEVPRTDLAMLASDHLPLVVDISLE